MSYLEKSGVPMGRLLTSRVLMPSIEEEIQKFEEFFSWKSRCKYCDMAKFEQESMENEETRVIYSTDDYIAFVPYAAKKMSRVTIVPSKHIPRFTEINQGKISSLAHSIDTV